MRTHNRIQKFLFLFPLLGIFISLVCQAKQEQNSLTTRFKNEIVNDSNDSVKNYLVRQITVSYWEKLQFVCEENEVENELDFDDTFFSTFPNSKVHFFDSSFDDNAFGFIIAANSSKIPFYKLYCCWKSFIV